MSERSRFIFDNAVNLGDYGAFSANLDRDDTHITRCKDKDGEHSASHMVFAVSMGVSCLVVVRRVI